MNKLSSQPERYSSVPRFSSLDEHDRWIIRVPDLDIFEGRVHDPQSLHKYLYANADPVDFTDPSGMFGFSIGGALGLGLRIAAWSAVGITAAYTAWSYLGPNSFARYGQLTSWAAWLSGAAKIDQYLNANISALERTYPQANHNDIFLHYGLIYPNVVSRKCDCALDDLMSQLRSVVQTTPGIRRGLRFVSGLINTTGPEPDNILILVPDEYLNASLEANLSNPGWYNDEAKKGIIFFYAGSVPLEPVGNLFDAITNPDSVFGRFNSLEVYNVPGESF